MPIPDPLPTRDELIEKLVLASGVERPELENIAWSLLFLYAELASEGGCMITIRNGMLAKPNLNVNKRLILDRISDPGLRARISDGRTEITALMVSKTDQCKPISIHLVKPPREKIIDFKQFENNDMDDAV